MKKKYMKVIAFDKIPNSGLYPEYDFGDRGERYWVKFIEDNDDEWCGKFSLGAMPGSRKAILIPNSSIAFILADGQGYFVEVNRREIIKKTSDDQLTDIIAIPESPLIAVTDGLTIKLLSSVGTEWESERVSVDGIIFLEATKEIIKGKFNCSAEEYCDFIFDISNRIFKANWILKEHWPA